MAADDDGGVGGEGVTSWLLACLNSSCSGNGNLTTATGGCKCGVRDCGRAGAEELGGDGVNFGTSIWVWWAAGGAKVGGRGFSERKSSNLSERYPSSVSDTIRRLSTRAV